MLISTWEWFFWFNRRWFRKIWIKLQMWQLIVKFHLVRRPRNWDLCSMLIRREPMSLNHLAQHKTSNAETRASRNPLHLRCGTRHTNPRAFQLSCSISCGTRAKWVPIEDREGTGGFKWHCSPPPTEESRRQMFYFPFAEDALSLSLPLGQGEKEKLVMQG